MDHDEQKTTDYHTPDKGADCHTPINPERKDAFHTPSPHLSPEKALDDEDTPTRVLRPRSERNDVQGVESAEVRSSPRAPNALKEKSIPGKELGSSNKRNKAKKGSDSEKTNDGGSEKQGAHAKTRSTSSSPVTACSARRKDASCAQEELINHSPGGTRSTRRKRTSPVHGKEVNVEESREGVRKRRSQQDSSDDSSSKENYDPELVVDVRESETADAEGHVRRSMIRSGTTRGSYPELVVDARECERADAEDHARRSKVRSGTTRGSDPELVVEVRESGTADAEGHLRRSKVRSGTSRGGQERRTGGAQHENRVECQTVMEDESEHELAKGVPERQTLDLFQSPVQLKR